MVLIDASSRWSHVLMLSTHNVAFAKFLAQFINMRAHLSDYTVKRVRLDNAVRFVDCHFNEAIFLPLGGENENHEKDVSWSEPSLLYLDPRTKQSETEVQRIMHMQEIANQLPDAFTDTKRVTKSYIPAARVEIPNVKSDDKVTQESKARLKHRRPVGTQNVVPPEEKMKLMMSIKRFQSNIMNRNDDLEPTSVIECQSRHNWNKWKEEMQAELNSLNKRKVFGRIVFSTLEFCETLAFRLINDILDISKVDSDVIKLEATKFRPREHIFRYLRGTTDLGLFYSNNSKQGLVGYADTSYLSDPHKARSQTGYVFLNGGTTISWRSQKQTLVATSSNHAKFIVLHEASRECVMTQLIVTSCGLNKEKNPTIIHEDNATCGRTNERRLYQKRQDEHIPPRYFAYTQDLINDNQIEIKYSRPTGSLAYPEVNAAKNDTKSFTRGQGQSHGKGRGQFGRIDSHGHNRSFDQNKKKGRVYTRARGFTRGSGQITNNYAARNNKDINVGKRKHNGESGPSQNTDGSCLRCGSLKHLAKFCLNTTSPLYLEPLTGDVFTTRFVDCHFNEAIFPPLGGEKKNHEKDVSWSDPSLLYLDPRTKQSEAKVQKIMHMQEIANQLPEAFTDIERVTKSYIPAVNAPARVEIPDVKSVDKVTQESKARLKRGRPVGSKDKNPRKRKATENEIIHEDIVLKGTQNVAPT
ncbi:hypothetical protein Tco_0572439 [Tanacetum coccineum]